mgnify:FL=1
MKEKKEQENLFDNFNELDWWKKEWKDMPEFKMEDLSPEQSIIVHFETLEDRNNFSKLLGQTITTETKSIYYPKLQITRYVDKKYIDES